VKLGDHIPRDTAALQRRVSEALGCAAPTLPSPTWSFLLVDRRYLLAKAIGGADGDEEDDFLGHASVDISLMRNQDYLLEEVPLLGVKAKPGGFKSQQSFRRYSTVAVELRVERRVMRIVDPHRDFDPDFLDVPRHHESRPMHPPEVKGYRDLSQLTALSDPGLLWTTAGAVLELRESDTLLEMATLHLQQDRRAFSGWTDIQDVPLTWSLQERERLAAEAAAEEVRLLFLQGQPKFEGAHVATIWMCHRHQSTVLWSSMHLCCMHTRQHNTEL